MVASAHRYYGTTLVELIVVLGITSIVLGGIIGIVLQGNRVFARAMVHLGPQGDETLALKLLQRDLRQAKEINLKRSSPTQLEIVLPAKTSAGINSIKKDTKTGRLSLESGLSVRYFLGKLKREGDSSNWRATPNETGDTLFRIEGNGMPDSPTDLPVWAGGSNLPNASQYSDARVIITGITAHATIPNTETPTALFSYDAADDNGTSDIPTDDLPTDETRFVTVTLTAPVEETTAVGREALHHSVRIRYCLRNTPSIYAISIIEEGD